MLKRIEIKGFKSFKKKTVLTFSKGITAIVGPNGSGKSNIIDSICFGLGASSMRALRASKLTDLIFNSKDCNEAYVTLYLDNSSKIFPFDDEEIEITRIVTKKGDCIYKLNGKRVSRNKILEVLSLAKLSPDGHNIIKQGQITSILEKRPKERREIIDEIAGIKEFDEKKQKAQKELEEVELKIRETEIILNERKRNLEEIKKEKEVAEEYLRLKERLKFLKASIAFTKKNLLEKAIDGINTRIISLNKEREEIEKRKKELDKEVEKLEIEFEKISKEIEKKGGDSYLNIAKAIERLKGEISKLVDRSNYINKEIENIQKEIAELEAKKITSENLLKEKEKEYEEKGREYERIREVIEKEKAKFEEYFKFKEQEKEIAKLESRKSALEFAVNSKKEKLCDIRKELQEIKQKISELSRKVTNVRNELSRKNEELLRISREYGDLVRKRESVYKELKSVEDELSRLETLESAYRFERGRMRVISEILSLKQKINGIYGPVFQLFTVEKKYDKAIKVAAGDRLFYIVVENEDVAKKCIEHLKQRKAGYATFIPLNRVKANALNVKKPGVIDCAVNLISFDTKFTNVMNLIFGSTVVMESFDAAKKYIKEFRMVTLDGELFEKSGVISGGYIELPSFEGIRIIEKINELKTKRDSLQSQYTDLLSRVEEAKANRNILENEISRMKEEINTMQNELENLKNKENNLENQKSLLEKEIKEYEEEITSIKERLEQIKPKEEINIEELGKEIKELEEKEKKYRIAVELLKEEIKRLKQQIKDFEEQISKKKSRLKNLEEEREALKSKLSELDVELNNKLKEEESLKKDLSKLISRKREIEKLLREKKEELAKEISREAEISNKIRELEIEKRNKAQRLREVEEELSKYEDVHAENIDISSAKGEVYEIENKLKSFGNVNLKSLEIYEKYEKECKELEDKINKLKEEKDSIIKFIEDIEKRKRDTFFEVLENISKKFDEIFKKIFPGGEAKLELEDPTNPFESGLIIKARPGGKRLISIDSLSGGEKSLTAIAFLFAIQQYKPAPFYILDEPDSQLDENNALKFARMLKELAKNTQFILISHNETVVSFADYLYGVSMQNGESQVISLKLA